MSLYGNAVYYWRSDGFAPERRSISYIQPGESALQRTWRGSSTRVAFASLRRKGTIHPETPSGDSLPFRTMAVFPMVVMAPRLSLGVAFARLLPVRGRCRKAGPTEGSVLISYRGDARNQQQETCVWKPSPLAQIQTLVNSSATGLNDHYTNG